jgi:hypothetical protein
MASILVSSEQRLVLVLFGQQVECLWPNFGTVSILSSGIEIPEGPDALLNTLTAALAWVQIETSPPRTPLDLGPLWGQMFRFQDDAVGQPDYYGIHDGVLGVRENTSLPAILLVFKDWLQNAGIGG